MSMDEIIPNLWVGDLPSALDAEKLREHNIRSILTAMRGRVSIHETFIRHQINIDDTETADILQHFVPSITFIQAELDKGWGVLVHCQAGMSRSVSVVAAYLMFTQELDAEGALDLIRRARPDVQPNEGFMRQLEIFHRASYKVSKGDKETRMFYLERVVNEVMNGGGDVETEMFAKFPQSPSDSPHPAPRRRIRCKMCRQELATREHMLDHGQLGPPTPLVLSAAPSRRPSMNDPKPLSSLASGAIAPRRASGSSVIKPLVQSQGPPLSPSSGMSRRPSMHDTLSRSRLGSISEVTAQTRSLQMQATLLQLDSASAQIGRSASDLLSESAVDEDSTDEEPSTSDNEPEPEPVGKKTRKTGKTDQEASALPSESSDKVPPLSIASSVVHSNDLVAQLAAHPKLVALRSPAALSMTPVTASSSGGYSPPSRSAPQTPGILSVKMSNFFTPTSPPILANPKCSGYFVEPMKWMEPFLEQGHMAGKIMCPNKKCGAKLGNYDWAGVCCSCKEWVVPGFCIHRSKVDEIA